jgi:hypothetical protein
MTHNLDKLYELIDEAITMDKVDNVELGQIVRKWFWSGDDELEWDDLTEGDEWAINGWDDDDDDD